MCIRDRVIAETRAVKALYPETDVIIELGGEDAKVTYLGQTAEHRMNCLLYTSRCV